MEKQYNPDGSEYIDLLDLAYTGVYSPMDFALAAYNVPGVNHESFAAFRDQKFNKVGFPITEAQAKAQKLGD